MFGSILNYDFTIVFTNFIQNIRNVKNIVIYKHETEYIYGDLIEYDIDLWNTWDNKTYPKEGNKKSMFKLNLFNNDTLHSEMNLMFINILLPYIDENRKHILKRLSIEGLGNKFLLSFFLFLISTFIINFFFLLSMIRYLNNFIYKTKNMLLLIPMSILTSQSNIKSLLKV